MEKMPAPYFIPETHQCELPDVDAWMQRGIDDEPDDGLGNPEDWLPEEKTPKAPIPFWPFFWV